MYKQFNNSHSIYELCHNYMGKNQVIMVYVIINPLGPGDAYMRQVSMSSSAQFFGIKLQWILNQNAIFIQGKRLKMWPAGRYSRNAVFIFNLRPKNDKNVPP